MITKTQADILDHTSNRAAGGFYCGNSESMQSLVALGFMASAGHKAFVEEEYFVLTAAGRAALSQWRSAQPKPKIIKRRRSPAFQQWRAYLDATYHRVSFPEFLKEIWPSYQNAR
jgi:hypothetical protein